MRGRERVGEQERGVRRGEEQILLQAGDESLADQQLDGQRPERLAAGDPRDRGLLPERAAAPAQLPLELQDRSDTRRSR